VPDVSSEYNSLAYKRTMLAHVRRSIVDDLVGADQPAKKELICEEVLYVDRNVPQNAILDFLEFLQKEEDGVAAQMRLFELRKRDDHVGAAKNPKVDGANGTEKPKPRGKSSRARQPAETGGS
jgi:hypothetical protein